MEGVLHFATTAPLAWCARRGEWCLDLVRSGREDLPWRMAYHSASQTGTHAIALAGLAVTMGLSGMLPAGLRVLGEEDGLPRLPDFEVAMRVRHSVPLAERLGRHISDSFRMQLQSLSNAA